jgi:hypothetical protein
MASTGPLTCLSTVASPQRARASASVEDEHKGRSDYQLKGPAAPQSLTCRSIAAEAAWRLDADEIVEIELDDGLQGGAGGGVTQIVWQDVIPGGVFRLQGDQLSNSVVPTPCAGSPVGWPSVADHRHWLLGLASRTMAGLAFGVAERVLTFGLSASGHGLSTVM